MSSMTFRPHAFGCTEKPESCTSIACMQAMRQPPAQAPQLLEVTQQPPLQPQQVLLCILLSLPP